MHCRTGFPRLPRLHDNARQCSCSHRRTEFPRLLRLHDNAYQCSCSHRRTGFPRLPRLHDNARQCSCAHRRTGLPRLPRLHDNARQCSYSHRRTGFPRLPRLHGDAAFPGRPRRNAPARLPCSFGAAPHPRRMPAHGCAPAEGRTLRREYRFLSLPFNPRIPIPGGTRPRKPSCTPNPHYAPRAPAGDAAHRPPAGRRRIRGRHSIPVALHSLLQERQCIASQWDGGASGAGIPSPLRSTRSCRECSASPPAGWRRIRGRHSIPVAIHAPAGRTILPGATMYSHCFSNSALLQSLPPIEGQPCPVVSTRRRFSA